MIISRNQRLRDCRGHQFCGQHRKTAWSLWCPTSGLHAIRYCWRSNRPPAERVALGSPQLGALHVGKALLGLRLRLVEVQIQPLLAAVLSLLFTHVAPDDRFIIAAPEGHPTHTVPSRPEMQTVIRRSPNSSRWMRTALLLFRNPTVCATLSLGGMLTQRCM